MLYITAEEAARRWGVTTRLVQRYCKQGRIAGAEKLGGSWRIPEGTVKPDDPRRGEHTSAPQVSSRRPTSSFRHLMPLMGTAYAPGTAKAFVASLANGTRASVAQAEQFIDLDAPHDESGEQGADLHVVIFSVHDAAHEVAGLAAVQHFAVYESCECLFHKCMVLMCCCLLLGMDKKKGGLP